MTAQPVFRAIADPTRRAIISLLAHQEMSVGEVANAFDISRPAIAKHLGILREADLVRSQKRGRETINQLQPGRLKAVADWLEFYDQFWDDKLMKLKSAVESENDGS